MSPILTMGHKVRTLQLKQHTLACKLCASLMHVLNCKQDLLVAARHTVHEDVHVIAVLEQVQGGR